MRGIDSWLSNIRKGTGISATLYKITQKISHNPMSLLGVVAIVHEEPVDISCCSQDRTHANQGVFRDRFADLFFLRSERVVCHALQHAPRRRPKEIDRSVLPVTQILDGDQCAYVQINSSVVLESGS